MHFCEVILILKMEENKQRFQRIMLYYIKKGKNATETQKICAAYGEGVVADRTCQKWFVKFHAGNFLLDDAPWSGGPVEVDTDQIETLIENNQCYTMRERADILKIFKSINLLVKITNAFYFTEKNHIDFCRPNIWSYHQNTWRTVCQTVLEA